MLNLKVLKDEITISGDDSFLGKLIAGTKGNVKVKTPFGERTINKVKDSKGKVLKDKNHPEKVGKIEK